MLGEHDTGNHRIAQFTRAAFLMPRRHQITCLLRSSNIEGSHSITDLVENGLKRLHECGSSLSCMHDLQSESDLKNRDRISAESTFVSRTVIPQMKGA